MTKKLVYGVGIDDTIGQTETTCYGAWRGMIQRCYSALCQVRHPTYVGCSVCDEWLTYSIFRLWYDEHYREGYQLDKDILVPGNKVYSPKTCRMVPKMLNTIINRTGHSCGLLPRGVSLLPPGVARPSRVRATYLAQVSQGGRKLQKTFNTPEEAQAWYAETKRRIVREVAQRYLDAGEIQQDIFDALVARTFVDPRV